MLDRLARLLGVSTTVTALMIGLVVVQLATQVYALVDLARRNAVRGGKKWPWALAVALGNLPGAIAYLVAGRLGPDEAVPSRSGASTAGGEAARRAVDVLYKKSDRH